MNDISASFINIPLELRKEQQRVKEDQEWQKKALVDKWMQDEAMVENAMLKAIQEVSGDMALISAEIAKKNDSLDIVLYSVKAVSILQKQIRKELEEQAEEYLYG